MHCFLKESSTGLVVVDNRTCKPKKGIWNFEANFMVMDPHTYLKPGRSVYMHIGNIGQ